MTHKWWHEKVAYQIYPKSFCDSNGDGVGDLQGIISKLDYLKGLGVDIVWLSPIYCSPLADQGYDISDYYNIDPLFGTMGDMDELLAQAKQRDISIVMDLVVNHCSDEHEWFKKACADPDGRYGKFFYIRDWKEGDPLPCNWRSYFGGPCWEKLPGHDDKIYFHAFHKKQPDLNWENPDLREEVYKMINWWLDKGLGGFRLDAIINIKKLLPFRDFPADREDGLCRIDCMQEQATGIGQFLGEMRDRTFAPHNAFTVGEVFNEKPEDIPDFIGDNGYFSSMFDFAETILNRSIKGWYDQAPVTPEQYKAACFQSQKKTAGIGFLSNLIENHDESRGVCRYIPEGDLSLTSKKMLAGLYFMLRGLPWIYQGQELGMENPVVRDISQVNDVSALDEYQVALDAGLSPAQALKSIQMHCRDNARTPYQWDDSANAGFTTGTPWLPVNPNYQTINLAAQIDDEDSIYNWYRKLIQLRKDPEWKETVVYGELIPYLAEQKNLMAYCRRGEKTLLVAGNFQRQPQTMALPAPVGQVLLNNLDSFQVEDGQLHLEGYQFVVFSLEEK
ncbi:MAG: alpha-glucosidase [Clostridiales bacterium]|nr:alpha-glucosidase [Clostridiales bacterium]